MFADDILGDFKKRYFGAGHKRTNYYLKNVGEEGKAELSYVDSWSEKNGCLLKPLSDIRNIFHWKNNNCNCTIYCNRNSINKCIISTGNIN